MSRKRWLSGLQRWAAALHTEQRSTAPTGLLLTLLQPTLKALSVFYHVGLKSHRALYDADVDEEGILRRHRLPVPVISVGNATWGGTGKTPMVELIARELKVLGRHPLVLTRGYGNDECKQLASHLRGTAAVGVGANRYLVGMEQLSGRSGDAAIDICVLDDGLQHWKLHRDLDILMVNALDPFGGNSEELIPRGVLREPVESAVSRAGVVVLHHAALVPSDRLQNIETRIRKAATSSSAATDSARLLLLHSNMEIKGLAPLQRTPGTPLMNLNDLAEYKVLLLCGIGNKSPLVNLLSGICVDVEDFGLLDHEAITKVDFNSIAERILKVQQKTASSPRTPPRGTSSKVAIVCTEKDYFRDPDILRDLQEELNVPVWIAVAEMTLASSEHQDHLREVLRTL